MAQEHLDRLSAVDAAFLQRESRSTPMHIGGIALFEGPPPAFGEVLEHVRGRLHLVPRYRQRLATPPLRLGPQRWLDDPRINLEYHVRHTALPEPGDEQRLHRLAARIFSQRLDRTKPLWELWMVEGLAGGGFALISKAHHALVDGVAGVDLVTTLFDLDREPPPALAPPEPWTPSPSPSPAQLAAIALEDSARQLAALPVRAAGAVAAPDRALSAMAQDGAALAGALRRRLAAPAPDTPLNVPVGPHRRVAVVRAQLADFKTVKDSFGGTVNDVVVAVVAGAVRRLLHSRGTRTEGLDLRVCVPVSTRAGAAGPDSGGQLAQVVVPLPVAVADPLERLRVVREATADVTESRAALGAGAIAEMAGFAPPTLLAQASRLNFAEDAFDLLVTNIPGPQRPLFVLGRELQAVYPLAFLAGDRALAVAAMSYNGGIDFGLIADFDAVPDLDVVATAMTDGLAEYVALAAGAKPPRGGQRVSRARRAGRARAAGT